MHDVWTGGDLRGSAAARHANPSLTLTSASRRSSAARRRAACALLRDRGSLETPHFAVPNWARSERKRTGMRQAP
jgi:hypothetical protein